MKLSPSHNLELVQAIEACRPRLRGVVREYMIGDILNDSFIKIFVKIQAGTLPVDRGTARPYVHRVVYRTAIDKVRGPRCKPAVVDRLFRQLVADGFLEDTPQDREKLKTCMERNRRHASPQHPTSLNADPADRTTDGLSKILADVLYRSIAREDPDSLLILKICRGMSFKEIAAHEQRRLFDDMMHRDVNPLEYATNVCLAKNKFREQLALWRHGRRDKIEAAIRELGIGSLAILGQLHDLYEAMDRSAEAKPRRRT
jgi:DNA-directed RNA polymerase specialized sigma24 family protein